MDEMEAAPLPKSPPPAWQAHLDAKTKNTLALLSRDSALISGAMLCMHTSATGGDTGTSGGDTGEENDLQQEQEYAAPLEVAAVSNAPHPPLFV